MRVTYNTSNTGGSAVVLSALGDFEILGETVERVPAAAPLRERHTLRLRLKFFETTYEANAALVATARAAVSRQQGKLTIEKEGGTKFVDREVTVQEDMEPEDDRSPLAGTSRQGITLLFAWTVHLTNAAGAALSATYQRNGSGTAADLGAVERWNESLAWERFDPLKPGRRMATGTVSAAGWFKVDTALEFADRQAALLAARDAVLAELRATGDGTLIFGTGSETSAFNHLVRVAAFSADVNQPLERVDWSLTATWIDYPDTADFSLLEFTVASREHYRDGSADQVLSGRITAATLTAAQTRLATLKAAYGTTAWALVEEDATPSYGVSESGSGGDGTTWLALNFTCEWRRIGALKPTFQRAGHSAIALGAVDKWAERYTAQFMDDLRDQRRRATGTLEAGGWLPGSADVLTSSELVALKDTVMSELAQGATGTLTYGTWSQTVRVADFTAEINQPLHRIEWRLAAIWTRFPNETNYALVEFTVSDAVDHATGQATKRLAGRIGAPASTAARTKLELLRSQWLASAGTPYTLLRENTEERRLDADLDGTTFVELTFADDWVRADGDVVHYTLRISESDDLGSGWVRQSYSGTVTARGSTPDAAYAAAAAQAATLGGNKSPFLLLSTLQQVRPRPQTNLNEAGTVVQNAASPANLVTVEFTYEYKAKGTRVYAEYSVALAGVEAGVSTQNVQGTVVGPTLADCQALYATLKAGYANSLLLNENTQEGRQRVGSTEYFDRLGFAFTVHVAKTGITATYTVTSESDWTTLTRNTTIRGQVWGPTAAACGAWVDALAASLNTGNALGNRVANSRTDANQAGRSVAGAVVPGTFLGLDFAETYTAALTGFAGIVECAVSEEVRHSGTRWIEKPLPDGPSIFQSAGTVAAERVVQGTVKALTRDTCHAWASRCRRLLLVGPNGKEHPPQYGWAHSFARLVSGLPVADGATPANVQCHTLTFSFRESLSELAWTAKAPPEL